MDILKIHGGERLEGNIRAAGSKNTISKLLVASLVSDQPCTFHNVPDIQEVEITVNLCCEIGSHVEWDRTARTLTIQTKQLKTSYVPQRYSGSNRIPILMIGALLGRTDEDIIVPTVGGDLIGKRPVDLHIQALERLGASIEYREMKKEGAYLAHAHHGLNGSAIHFSYPSVGATENAILAAVRARGVTRIYNGAVEPEILDLILFLQKLGVLIRLDSDRTIVVQQTHHFFEVEHTVLTDRNEVVSYAMAALSTKGKIFIEGADPNQILFFLDKVREIGGGIRVLNQGIEFSYEGPLRGGILIETDVHPGFMTDWQQPFVVLLTQAHGFSVVHETVYENRFGYTRTLQEMGADLQLFSECLGSKSCRFHSGNYHHSLVVRGPTPLKSCPISIPDLRAGFAYVMAALLAPEETTITNVAFLDRGYEDLVGKLSQLGGKVSRETVPIKKELKELTSRPKKSATVRDLG